MFNFFKKKTPFETYYAKITSLSVVRTCEYYRPFTAAYLYIISDFCLGSNYNKRRANADFVFSFLEKNDYSDTEMEMFDDAVDLFGQILNKEIEPRGDWCLYDGEDRDPFSCLFMCYGDLINDFEYIDDYEESPIPIRGIDFQMSFAANFRQILYLTAEYVKAL